MSAASIASRESTKVASCGMSRKLSNWIWFQRRLPGHSDGLLEAAGAAALQLGVARRVRRVVLLASAVKMS
jgi:hypothetical protein